MQQNKQLGRIKHANGCTETTEHNKPTTITVENVDTESMQQAMHI
jgi:hypothetical protein